MKKLPKAFRDGKRTWLRRTCTVPLYGCGVYIVLVPENSHVDSGFLQSTLGEHCGILVEQRDAFMTGLGKTFMSGESDPMCLAIVISCVECNGERLLPAGTVAHEIWHAVTYVATRIGLPLDHKNDEALSYMAGWFGDQIACLANEYGIRSTFNRENCGEYG